MERNTSPKRFTSHSREIYPADHFSFLQGGLALFYGAPVHSVIV